MTFSIITTVKISPEQEAKIKILSRKLGLTKGAVIRLAIDRLIINENPTMQD